MLAAAHSLLKLLHSVPIGNGTNAQLILSLPVLTQIYTGQVTNWNDPVIAALNPHVAMPNLPITLVVVRYVLPLLGCSLCLTGRPRQSRHCATVRADAVQRCEQRKSRSSLNSTSALSFARALGQLQLLGALQLEPRTDDARSAVLELADQRQERGVGGSGRHGHAQHARRHLVHRANWHQTCGERPRCAELQLTSV